MKLSPAGVSTPSISLLNTARHTARLSLLSIAITLTACGGGGGGDATGGSPGPIAPAPSQLGNLATSVPTPSYAAASTELAMFNQINAIRLNGGFGMLAQDPVLDTAALNHARYLSVNYLTAPYANLSELDGRTDAATGWLMGHVEKAAWANFSGILPLNRIEVAGAKYLYSGEVISFNATDPADCVPNILNTIFHRNAFLLTSLQRVGLAYIPNPSMNSSICVLEPAYKTNDNLRPANWVGIYPADGQVSLPTGMPFGEVPDPAPEIANSQKGSPVSIYVDQDLSSVTSFTLTAAGASAATSVKFITAADFPVYLGRKESHILPTQPLVAATRYNVSFRGVLVNGKKVDKDWSFTTK